MSCLFVENIASLFFLRLNQILQLRLRFQNCHELRDFFMRRTIAGLIYCHADNFFGKVQKILGDMSLIYWKRLSRVRKCLKYLNYPGLKDCIYLDSLDQLMYIKKSEEVQISSDEKMFKEIPLTEEPRQLREVAE